MKPKPEEQALGMDVDKNSDTASNVNDIPKDQNDAVEDTRNEEDNDIIEDEDIRDSDNEETGDSDDEDTGDSIFWQMHVDFLQ